MEKATIKIINRDIETKTDALVFGAAEALGKGLVYAAIFAGIILWARSMNDDDAVTDTPSEQIAN